MKKYFKDLDEHEKCIVRQMCEDIENRDIVFISAGNRFKVMGKNRSFMSDWTYNLCRWGFARKARNSDFHAQQHAYCPNQHMSGVIANFINTAVDMGLYERKTRERFDGGQDFQTIWM